MSEKVSVQDGKGARLRAVIGLLLLVVAACVGGASAPAVTPTRTLAPNGAETAVGPGGPFRVVFAGPEGKVSAGSEISIVFSRPLRALELAGNESAPPISITPRIEGRWQWVGTSALIFVPGSGRLPAASRVVVTVPGETRALDGATLGRAYRFEFETPRPKLVRSTPYSGERGLVPNAQIELYFNQPIDPKQIEKLGTLTVNGAQRRASIAFKAHHPDAAMTKRVSITPAGPLPIHSAFTLEIGKALTGQEGPLPAGEPIRLGFQTYGPLEIESVSCDDDTPHRHCAPGSSLAIQFSNPVKVRDVKRLVSVAGARLRWGSLRDEDDFTTYADVVAQFKAGSRYTLRVGGELTDKYGQRLGKAFVRSVDFDDYWPTVEVGARGDYLEAAATRAIPVGSVNVARYELVTAPLLPDDVMRLVAIERDTERLGIVEKLAAAKKRELTPRAPKNQIATEHVDPATLLGANKRGPVAVGARYPNPRNAPREEVLRVVQLTDLGISAKLSRHGSLVWVTKLSTGEPVSGASVELRIPGAAPRKYQADAQGVAQLPARDFAPNFYDDKLPATRAVLFVRSGDDWTYRRVLDFVEPWRLPISVDLSGTQKPYGLMFTERGIYRPGDTVQLKGIVRLETPTGNAVPAGRPLEIVLRSPDEQETAKRSVTTSRFGTFALALKVPEAAHLGSWQVVARGLEHGEISDSFEVAEYRPAEFKVSVESDRPSYVRGDQARFIAHGDYLFGAPMAKAAAQHRVTRTPTSFVPSDSDGFVTDAGAYYADRLEQSVAAGELESGQARLDPRGETRFTAKLELPEQRGPELLSADAEVTDVSRQSIGGGTSAIVHPAEYYVGLKAPDDWFVTAPGTLTTSVVALLPDGKRLPGKKLLVELVRRRFTLARQETGSGALHSLVRPVDNVVNSCIVTTSASPVGCSLKLAEGGYYIVHATSKDGRGNVAHAALGVYGIGSSGGLFSDRDERTIDLVANKKSYKVGDRAKVLVKSPFQDAEAIVTVERAGVYRVERVRLKGPTPIVEVPVTDDLRPNAFVGVHLIRPRTKAAPATRDAADPGAPTYRFGYAELVIDPEARRLAVAVKPNKRDLRPGEELTVDLQVKDRAGKPERAEVTLYAVDEGVLSLIGYRTPDPLPVFTAARPLQVATLESRDALAKLALAELGGALGLEKGQQGGGGGMSAVRRDFRQSAYFDPDLVTDAAGRASVHFKLPESLTTYRVMAVATTEGDRYGFGAATVTTSKRLMARPALPRFVRSGDSLEAGVVVTTKGYGPQNVGVRAQVNGLDLVGAPTKSVKVGKNESIEVRFPMRATKPGKASLRFDVTSEGERDAVEVTRPVELPTLMESVALYGETKANSGEKLGDLSSVRRDVGSLELSVASTALVGLEAGVEQLIEYPYGCTEQVSSRLMPLLPLRDLARDFAIRLPGDTELMVRKSVADLIGRQRGDGGFGMWPDSPESSPWISAYALFTLDEAKRRGGAVTSEVIDHGRDYLRRFLAQLENDPLWFATAAFVVDVLAELDAPDTGYMSRLYQERKRLPLFSRALLLHAMAKTKQKADLVETLIREIENQLRIETNAAYVAENLGDEYAVLMDSQARTGALVLRGLLAAKPAHALGGKLARGLLSQRRGGSWRSTQESAWALLALDAYRKAQETALPDYMARVFMGEAEILSAPMRGRSSRPVRQTIALDRLSLNPGAVLAFQKDGSGTLFYEARLRYAKVALPTTALERGFFVQKTLRAVSVDGLEQALRTIPEKSSTEVQAGDLVIGDLVVVTPSPREFVVIDDPLPAGLEAVDARLATTAAWLDVPNSGGEPRAVDCVGCDKESDDAIAHGRAFLDSWYRRELRDDRVLFFVDHMAAGMYHYRYLARATTFGHFVLPPTKAEEMYTPEVFGRTGAAALQIR